MMPRKSLSTPRLKKNKEQNLPLWGVWASHWWQLSFEENLSIVWGPHNASSSRNMSVHSRLSCNCITNTRDKKSACTRHEGEVALDLEVM